MKGQEERTEATPGSGLGDEGMEELRTLQFIYPELVLDESNPCKASLDLLVAPASPLVVTFVPGEQVERLAYLPSLHVHVILPTHYPAEAAPSIALSTSPSWLPHSTLQRLTGEARSMWEEYGRCPMLFAYISSLQEQAEACYSLKALTLPAGMKAELKAYDVQAKKEVFDKATFDCQVCLDPKKGTMCHRMRRCGHVFCVACLHDYYSSCIKEGHVHNVKCMSPECGQAMAKRRKKEPSLSPKELLEMQLPRETVERYVKLKRKKKIESDPTITFCPRSWCQGAMRTDKYPKITDWTQLDDSSPESEGEEEEKQAQTEGAHVKSSAESSMTGFQDADRLAVCEDCTFSFCVVCLRSWHGEFVRCEPCDTDQITEEDQASLSFIAKNTTPCPYCSVPCQKSMGCNHMTCARCNTHFCYLCSAWLNPDHPYAHFNDRKNHQCFQRLMDGAEGDHVLFAGRRGAEQVADFWEQEAMRIQQELDQEDA